MKKIKCLVAWIFFIIFSSFAIAEINLDMDIKQAFFSSDDIFFEYKMISDIDVNITYVANIICPDAPAPFFEGKKAELFSGFQFNGKYTHLTVTDELEPQKCQAIIEITEPEKKLVQKEFEIKTNPSFKFEILMDKVVYIKGDKIIINYFSEISEIILNTTLSYPDKTTKEIIFPYSFTAEQNGNYKITASASKQGYKTIKKNMLFGIIEKNAEIKDISKCNGNGKCEKFETQKNCPIDCTPYQSNAPIIIAALVILLLILLAFFISRKKVKYQ